jgi:hypothetical protein
MNWTRLPFGADDIDMVMPCLATSQLSTLTDVYIYPTFYILMYTIYHVVSISEGLKSPLHLWSCDNTMPNCSQEAVGSPMIQRLVILFRYAALAVVIIWAGDLTD